MAVGKQIGALARAAVVLGALTGGLGGCASIGLGDPLGWAGGFGGSEPAAEIGNPLLGASFAGGLGAQASREYKAAFADALRAAQPNAAQPWSAGREGVGGTVRVREAFLLGLDVPDADRLKAPARLNTDYVIRPDVEVLRTSDAVNVRLGPGLGHDVTRTLPAGAVVTSLGRTEGQAWLLVARGAQALGYMYAPLLQPVREGAALADDDLILAGGRSRQPVLCRDFAQEVRFADGRSDAWEGTACRQAPGRWRVVRDILELSS